MPIQSPITGSDNTTLEREIPSREIIDAYQKELGMDVSHFFAGIEAVSVYTCRDTGYRFYHPLTLAGDDAFYQEVEKFPWYYMDWKWEHGVADGLIQKDESVLEIGCARGSFLKKLRERGVHVEGLEMNTKALEECRAAGLTVHPDSIEGFSASKKGMYDVVCSFQVLEHVPHVREYLEASLAVLKPGGRMIVSVPNNDSLVLSSGGPDTLNAPPHHMGLWDPNSLIALQRYFNMTIEGLYLEPLQEYHAGFASKIASAAIGTKVADKLPLPHGLVAKLAGRFGYTAASALAPHIVGHSMIAVFTKNG
ncbi:MAG TPA: class I SAM-dependent methyltransferase [Candidatus Paceibacterota bacterium]|nr:class I SAM-dependent methyltransferase [Candidatus Paceibacterota bacterium]